MKTLRFAAFAVLLAVTVVTVTSLTSGIALARSPNNAQEGGSNKILVMNVPMGDSVVVAQNGQMIGPGVVAAIGGTIETFTGVGVPTRVYLWDADKGFTLLARFTPGAAWPDTVLNAAAPDVAFPNSGLASSITH